MSFSILFTVYTMLIYAIYALILLSRYNHFIIRNHFYIGTKKSNESKQRIK